MGVMSGLIATNGKEIQALRDLGDRNIYEFTLKKDGRMEKVGDIQLMLRKADAGHNRFSVDVLADDKRVEKERPRHQRAGPVLYRQSAAAL